MKIVRNTPEQLVLRSVPWFIAITLSAAFLAVIAFGLNALFEGNMTDTFWGLIAIPLFLALFLAVFVRRDDLLLDRSRNLLELRHSTFRGRTRIQHKLEHLERAMVQSSRTSKGGTTYRIALVLNGGMDAGTHPVTPVYTGGNGAKRGVKTINDWLAQGINLVS
ncbi:hypothetical protein QTO30_09540 [Yoonia sp. GPGPB17]|uniref:hypothetical protein n=1 Tax=Yoonia sp. GPGPB17 TaxID=3026147 RepID=UPI0030C56EED